MNLTLTRGTDPKLFSEIESLPQENRNLSWMLKNRPDLASRVMKVSHSGESLKDVPWYGDPTNYTPTDLIKSGIQSGVKGAVKNLAGQGLSLAAMEKAYDELEKKFPNHPILDTLASMMVPIAGSHVASKILQRYAKNAGKASPNPFDVPSGPPPSPSAPSDSPTPSTEGERLALPESVMSVPEGGFPYTPGPSSPYIPRPSYSSNRGISDEVKLAVQDKLNAWKRATGSEKDKAFRDLMDYMKARKIALKNPIPNIALPEPKGAPPENITPPEVVPQETPPVTEPPVAEVLPIEPGVPEPTQEPIEKPAPMVAETPPSDEPITPKTEEPTTTPEPVKAEEPTPPLEIPKTPWDYSPKGKLTVDGGANTKKTFTIPNGPPGSFSLSYSPENLSRMLSVMDRPELSVRPPSENEQAHHVPSIVTDQSTSHHRGVVMPFDDEKAYVKTESSPTEDPSATMGFMGTQAFTSPAVQKSLSLDKVTSFLKSAKETLGEHFIAPKTEAFHKYISAVGEFERVSAQMDMEVRHAMEEFDKLPQNLQEKIMDDFEHGRLVPATPELKTLVRMSDFRHQLWQSVKVLAGVDTDIPNYLAHIYKNPVEAEKLLGSFISKHGGMAGTLHYLKQRKISFYDVARDLGLEPLTTNPLRLQALTIRALNRYLMAHHFREQLERSGLAMRSQEAQIRKLHDWVPIQDKVMEGYVVPKEVEKIWRQNMMNESVKNALSPISSLSNTVNAIDLGLSAFHFMTTSLSSMARMGGIGLSEIINSATLRGLSPEVRKKMLASGIKDIVAIRAPYKYVSTGAAVRKRAKDLGMTAFGDVSAMTASPTDTILRAVALAGGRLQKPKEYMVTARSMQEAAKTWGDGRHLEGAAQMVPAVIEKLSEPLFEKWVPNLKIGMFAHFVGSILRENPGKTLEEMTPQLQKAWRSVDNSEGEVVYDNLGWSRIARMIAHLSVRSVGWNYGTISLFGHAVADQSKFVNDLVRGKGGRFTPDMGYIPMLVAVTGLAGSAIYGLQFGKLPDNIADALMPPMGYVDEQGNMHVQRNPDGTIRRWMMPTYLKDVFAYAHDPLQTMINKLNPLFEMTAEQIQNKNYYGETIAAPSDPLTSRLAERAASVAEGILPFSVTGLEQNLKHNSDLGTDVAPFVGFMPGPKYIVTTPAEEYASQLAESRMPPMKKSERDMRDLHGQIVQELRTDPKKGRKDLIQSIREKKITMETAKRLLKMSAMNPMEYHIRVLPMSDLLKVWDKASGHTMIPGASPQRQAQDLRDIRTTIIRRLMANPQSFANFDEKEKEKILQIVKGQEYASGKAS